MKRNTLTLLRSTSRQLESLMDHHRSIFTEEEQLQVQDIIGLMNRKKWNGKVNDNQCSQSNGDVIDAGPSDRAIRDAISAAQGGFTA